MNRWWRAYDSAKDDPKLLLLPSDTLRWQWFVLMCVASQHGGKLPSVEIVALGLRLPVNKAALVVAALHAGGLLDETPGGYFEPHNWKGRQFESDKDPTRNERQQRYRDRKRNALRNVPSNADVARYVTRTETETETDKERGSAALRAPPENVSRETKPKRAKARTSLPDDWKPSERDVEHATERGFRPEQISTMAAGFSNHHRARGNLMADWAAAWRTWVDNEIKFQRDRGNGQGRSRTLQDESLSVSRAIDKRLAAPGTLVFPPRPSLLPVEREDDRRLLPAGRGAES